MLSSRGQHVVQTQAALPVLDEAQTIGHNVACGVPNRRDRRFDVFAGDRLSFDSFAAMLPGSGCNIKGNVSINTGQRIYHVPGQKYYRETIIRSEYGERWFCSESDAREAGWRRSRV